MASRLQKIVASVVALALLIGAFFLEKDINHDREVLGLTKYTELKGAPPVLALTTVALGGFRGLISNALWIRANDLQDDGKYFEMVQLADWITKLEPSYTQVWLVQAWNMAYNISVKFKDARDRWRWVQRGIELLRDEGLKYNPDEILIYRELGWFFQHKMGQNLDDAHIYYKQMWANEMSKIFGMDRPNWDALLHPKTADETNRVELLRNKYKMDPARMKADDEKYGPLEWRLPEAHAIYWADLGLEKVAQSHMRTNTDDYITLRRVIYQSMQTAFQRGRLIANKVDRTFEFGPNLDIIPKVSETYERAMEEDPKNRDHIATAHRNFLRDAVFFLYTYNKMKDAAAWYKYLGEHYPNKSLIEGDTNSLPSRMSLDEYAIAQIQENAGDTDKNRVQAILEGLERNALQSLAIGDDDRYLGLEGLARKIFENYTRKTANNGKLTDAQERVGMTPLPDIKKTVLNRLLNGEISPELAAQLRTKLGMPPAEKTSTNTAPAEPLTGANLPPASVTNATNGALSNP